MVSGAPPPVILHLLLVLPIGLYLPAFLNNWFVTAAELLK